MPEPNANLPGGESTPDNRAAADRNVPSVAAVVDRLERLWASAPTQEVLGAEVEGLAFGRFEIQRLRGQGAFGVVYEAQDMQLSRKVALKAPRPHVLASAEQRRRFEAEAAAAAMLDHPGIVAVYEAQLAGPTPYIASAFCPGPDLCQWLAARGGEPIPWREAAAFIAILADAVEYAHQKGVYHRDLKPSNVLLSPRESASDPSVGLAGYLPKLTDFGLAKLAQLAATDTRSSLLLGTPLYMAPEQLEGRRDAAPAAADVYSLGCMLYELVAGRPPIEGDTYAAMIDRLREETPASLRQVAPEVPRDLAAVCARCLEKNPEARYATAGALAADLRACVGGSPIQGRRASLATRFRYWATRRERIRDAGWYALCVQTLLAVWMAVALPAAQRILDIPADQMARMYLEFFVLTFAVNLPMAAVGWYTTQYKPWAIRTGLVLSLVNLVAPIVFVAMSWPLFFAELYARVDSSNYLAFAVCSLVLLAELGQVGLYAMAWAAWRRQRRTE